MASSKHLKVQSEDRTRQKWCVPLQEDVFSTFLSRGSPTVHKVFGAGSLFSPLLFGKFFDPSDAFPLWEFESSILLADLRSSGQSSVDWFQTDELYILKAELPGLEKDHVQVCVENGKVVEVSGQWKQQRESKTGDWRSGHWWEYGYVRRLELPEDADREKIEAHVNNDVFLEIRIPKGSSDDDTPRENVAAAKDSETVCKHEKLENPAFPLSISFFLLLFFYFQCKGKFNFPIFFFFSCIFS
ncbi:21.7 kDa class VI heat shock protein [Malania oleifera]|uniref:21.7 kDa class VI heat shock protein n=1 Tax=Malania oleifera TaxID=397392 RepID=UPI0025AE5993|nr:21.7 kDa class VI heat shock protein [Malania oleifera]